jgi:hypothetical protein
VDAARLRQEIQVRATTAQRIESLTVVRPWERPQLRPLYDERTAGVLVYTWTNDTAHDIDSATSNLEFIEDCRTTLGHPQGVQRDPVWFLLDLKTVPDGYEYEFEGYRTPLMLRSVC